MTKQNFFELIDRMCDAQDREGQKRNWEDIVEQVADLLDLTPNAARYSVAEYVDRWGHL